jgi:hypothetical protein
MTYALSFITSQHRDRTNIFDVPRPDPCGHHTIHIQLPLIKDMLSSKIKQLQPRDRPKFIEKFVEYDSEVGKACSIIKSTLTKMVVKQYKLADTFAELIVSFARSLVTQTMLRKRLKQLNLQIYLSICRQVTFPHCHFFQFMYLTLCIYQLLLFKYYNFLITEAHIHKGTQNTQDLTMPYSQPNTELTGTQFEEIHEKQQQMCRAFEGCPDDLETNTNSNAEKQVFYAVSSWLHYMLISNLHPKY